MTKHAILGFLTLASVAILGSFFVPSGGTVFAILAAVFPVLLIALGAQRDGRLGPVWVAIGLLLAILVGSVLGMLTLRGQVADGPWLFGLPLAATLQLVALFLLPLFVVSLAYAWTFARWQLRDEDLDHLRRHFGKTQPGADR